MISQQWFIAVKRVNTRNASSSHIINVTVVHLINVTLTTKLSLVKYRVTEAPGQKRNVQTRSKFNTNSTVGRLAVIPWAAINKPTVQ